MQDFTLAKRHHASTTFRVCFNDAKILIGSLFKLSKKSLFKLPNLSTSNSFQASDITYVIISWEDECSSTMYRFEESSGQLVGAQTLAVSGYGRDWLAVEQGQEVCDNFQPRYDLL